MIHSSDMSSNGHVDVILQTSDAHLHTISAISPLQSATRFAASTILQFHLVTAVAIMVMAIALCISYEIFLCVYGSRISEMLLLTVSSTISYNRDADSCSADVCSAALCFFMAPCTGFPEGQKCEVYANKALLASCPTSLHIGSSLILVMSMYIRRKNEFSTHDVQHCICSEYQGH